MREWEMDDTWTCKAWHTRSCCCHPGTGAVGLLQGTGQEMQRALGWKSAQLYLPMLALRGWTVGGKQGNNLSVTGAWWWQTIPWLLARTWRTAELNPPPSQIWKATQSRESLSGYKARTTTHFRTSWLKPHWQLRSHRATCSLPPGDGRENRRGKSRKNHELGLEQFNNWNRIRNCNTKI